jgi:hypothetical protein
VFAHVAGIPVEETALSLGPVLMVVGGLAAYHLRKLAPSALRRARARDPRRAMIGER